VDLKTLTHLQSLGQHRLCCLLIAGMPLNSHCRQPQLIRLGVPQAGL
jgi:hypothetical protein